MQIIILGAGQVGATLAYNLARESNDITLIDIDEHRLQELKHKLDIQTVHGLGSHPAVLISAGIEQADMLIAVTRNDEVNMMACQVAYGLFQTPMKIARIRSSQYYDYPFLFNAGGISIDVCISPEKLVTQHISNLVHYPEAAQVIDFSDGKVLIVSIKIPMHSSQIGQSILGIHQFIKNIPFRILAIFRAGEAFLPEEDYIIQTHDVLLMCAPPDSVQAVLAALGRQVQPNRRIIIAGGGHIGAALAQALEAKYRVKIIEHNSARAHVLAASLNKTTVLHGDIADRELLVNENIEFTNIFCAVTNDDEANIMSCMQAKQLGASHVMALVNRPAYVDLIEDSTIDQAISPQLITIGFILTKLRGGNMVKIHRLPEDDNAEIIELVLHGDEQTSQVVGRNCFAIELPKDCSMAAVVRGATLHFPNEGLSFQAGDHVILLLLNRRYVRQIESLFQVTLSFMS